jgi:hypothetical protein
MLAMALIDKADTEVFGFNLFKLKSISTRRFNSGWAFDETEHLLGALFHVNQFARITGGCKGRRSQPGTSEQRYSKGKALRGSKHDKEHEKV